MKEKKNTKSAKDDAPELFGGLLLTAIIFQLGSFGVIQAFIIAMGSLWIIKIFFKYFSNKEKKNFQDNNQEQSNVLIQKIVQNKEEDIETKKSKKKWIWCGILVIAIIPLYNSLNDNNQDILLEKTDKSSEYSEQIGNLYRNTKYKFRIKFPEGWDINPGDGPNIIQKAVNGNNTISVMVREIPAEYSDKTATIKDAMSLAEFKNSFSNKEFQENFPGSELLDYGETKLDNKITYWVKYSAPYSAMDINVEGIILQYQLLHKNIAYFITAGALSSEFDAMESELKRSIATFVIEDY